jgi:hypothetical protein
VNRIEQETEKEARAHKGCRAREDVEVHFMLFKLLLNSSSCVNRGIVFLENCFVVRS